MARPRPTAWVKGALLTGCLWLGLSHVSPGADDPTLELAAVLRSDASLEEKAIACRRLGEVGTVAAVPALASLLGHDLLATYARTALERIPDPSAAAALRSALETTDGKLLVGVITSLSALGDDEAVDRFIQLAFGDDEAASPWALLALGRVGSPRALEAVKRALALDREGAAAAALLAAEQQLAGGQTAEAVALYDAVRFADAPRPLRLGAIRGAILARGSVPLLMEQLESEDAAVRAVALLAVREMPSPALAEALHRRLDSASPGLAVQIVTALADCHDHESFAVACRQLQADDERVRRAALGAIGALGGGPDLAVALLDVVRGRRSPEESQTALGLLTRMEGGPEVERVILDALRDAQSVDVRVDVMRVLGDRQAAEAVPVLLEEARDEAPRVRGAAFRSLRRLAGPDEVPSLIALISSEEDGAAKAAAVSTLIAACGDDGLAGERVLAELRRASEAPERDVWIRALTAMGHPKALPVLLEGLESGDTEAVAATIGHLGRWPDPAPVAAILPFLADDAPPVRRRAVSAVIQLATNAADRSQRPDDVLLEWFGRADAAVETIEEKRQILSGLGRVPTLGSLRLLEPYLHDPEVEVEALYALLAVGSPLVRAGHPEAVAEALPEESSLEDSELRRRLGELREQVIAARPSP